MLYSYPVEQAIRAASILHKDQVRKGGVPYMYITHLFAVLLIVSDYTQEENTLVAALLHDTLDDTDYTEKELEDDFGGQVKDIVVSISELVRESPSFNDTAGQKREFLKKLREAPQSGLLILAADKIHNMRSIVEEYYDDHSRFIADFGTFITDRLAFYEGIHAVLNKYLKNAILAEFNSVFAEYKQFLSDVEKKQYEF